MASRRKSRIAAFQAVYAWDASPMPMDELLSFSWLNGGASIQADDELKTFASLIVAGTIENIRMIDDMLAAHLRNWRIERLKKVDLAILRIAIYSLLFQTDIDARITIDEAVEIAKEFGADDSYKFINGVLDSVWKENDTRHA